MKFSKILLTACMVVATASVFAQEAETQKPWKLSGVVGLNASATGMVNWAAGGTNNVTGVAFGKLRLLYGENNLSWETNLDLEYGLSYLDQKYDKLQKSSDHVIFNTKFGWAFAPKWFLTAQAGFQSQFALGRNYPGDGTQGDIISKWLAPSYTDVSVGIDWKPNDIFSLYLSPVAGRITTAYVGDNMQKKYVDFLRETQGNADLDDYDLRQVLQSSYGTWKYSNDPSASGAYDKVYSNVRAELGLTFKGAINYTYKDLKIITNLSLFTPYTWDRVQLFSDADGNVYTEQSILSHPTLKFEDLTKAGFRDNNRRFGNFDVDWTVAISYQFLKCLNVTLSTDLRYYNGVMIADKDGNLGERVQFKAILGLGVGYSF